MKQSHHLTMKFHTIYSIVLAFIFVVMILVFKSIALSLALVLLFSYVAGNGLLHVKNNQLTRDIVIEYSLVSLVVFVILIDVLL